MFKICVGHCQHYEIGDLLGSEVLVIDFMEPFFVLKMGLFYTLTTGIIPYCYIQNSWEKMFMLYVLYCHQEMHTSVFLEVLFNTTIQQVEELKGCTHGINCVHEGVKMEITKVVKEGDKKKT